jgi:hypothetical protein
MIAPLLVGIVSLSVSSPPQSKWPWPPPGARWETVPARAFERARKERKAVMVYVATAD